MSIRLTEPAAGPVTCKPWCIDGSGHPKERYREDQACLSEVLDVPLSLHEPFDQIGGGKAQDWLQTALIHRPDEQPEIELFRFEMPGDVKLTVAETRELIEHLQLLLGLVDGASR